MPTTQWKVVKSRVTAEHGMVLSEHPAVTQAGLEVLKDGGNAVDAAVAMGFAIGVCGPFMSGLGGGGHMVIFNAQSGETAVLDYPMRAPRAATPDMFELLDGTPRGNFGWRPVKDDANGVGYRSITVPGTIAGLCLALEQFGTMGRADVLKHAIRLAESGFDVDLFLAVSIASRWGTISRFPKSRWLFLDAGGNIHTAPSSQKPASRMVQKDLARTLRQVAREGPDAYYRGKTGAAVAGHVRKNQGLLSEEDLASYRADLHRPGLVASYRGFTVVAPPVACGGPTVVEALHILDQFDLGAFPHNSADALHFIAEALRLAFRDRFQLMGDSSIAPTPYDKLASMDYARGVASSISGSRALDIPPVSELQNTRLGPPTSPETTQLCVVDRERNMVSITQTLQTWSGVIPPGTGVPLNGAMSWFNPQPGRANSIEGGKRILANMSPVVVLREGRPILAMGAPGGRKIISAVVQVLVNVLDYGMEVQRAVAAPRLDASDSQLQVDSRVPRESRRGLVNRGHQVQVVPEGFLQRMYAGPAAIQIDQGTGQLRSGLCEFDLTTAAGY